MPSGFPNSIDSFTDPLASSPLNSPSHAGQHQDLNDAVNKIETFMGLVFVKSQVVGTGVSSVTVTDAFSALYDNYRILYTGGIASTPMAIKLRLGTANTEYYGGIPRVNISAGDANLGINNQDSFIYGGFGDGNTAMVDADLYLPFQTKMTIARLNWLDSRVGDSWGTGGGVHRVATSFTAFSLIPSGTLTGGTIRVYGYRN
jgi:hypothetical protein